MDPTFNVKLAGLDKAIEETMLVTRKTLVEQINQTTFNVAARGMHATPIESSGKIRTYLGAFMADTRGKGGSIGAVAQNDRFQQYAGGGRKKAAASLRRVTLIAQKVFFKTHGYGIGKGKSNKRTKRTRQVTAQQASRIGKDGKLKKNDYGYSLAAKPGKTVVGSDYGEAMIKYVGKMFNRAVRSPGYLAAVFVPALRLLGPLVKFKGLASGLPYRVLWAQGSAHGTATAASDGSLRARITGLLSARRMTDKSQQILDTATQQAMADEERELRRHTEEQLQKAFQKLTR